MREKRIGDERRLFDHMTKKKLIIKLCPVCYCHLIFLYSRFMILYFLLKQKKEHCQEGKSAYGKVVVGRGVKEKMRERGRNEKSESELNGQEEKAQGWEKKEDNDGDRK